MGLFSHHDGAKAVCPALPSPAIDSLPLFGNWTAHKLFLVIGGAFAAAAVVVSLVLYMLHATHFSNPQEQSKILRIIFFIPFSAIIAFCCIVLNDNALYLAPWNYVYEAFALSSFFMLVCTYVSPEAVYQQQYFNTINIKEGAIPGGKWFANSRRAVFQYVPVAILVAAITDITLAAKVYCQNSNSVHFAHIWLTVIRVISVVFASLAAIRFTMRLKSTFSHHQILKKLFALKAVIFLEAIQNLIFSVLRSYIHPSTTMSYVDIGFGIPAVILCVELFLVSIFLHFAYPWRPYVGAGNYRGGPLGIAAILSALNPTDVLRSFAYAFGVAGPSRTTERGSEYGQYEFRQSQSSGFYPAGPQQQYVKPVEYAHQNVQCHAR